jgi:hypothetical protein
MESGAEGPGQRGERVRRFAKGALILYSPFVLALALYRRVSWLALMVGLLAGVMLVVFEAVVIWQRVAVWSGAVVLDFRPTIRVMMVVFAAAGIILTFTIGPLIGLGLVTAYVLWSWSARDKWIARLVSSKHGPTGESS